MMKNSFKIYTTSKEAWSAMYQAIFDAKKSIYWESYIFMDDEIGKPFFDLLEKKSQEGIEVKLIVDSFGSYGLSKSRVNSLRQARVELLFFNERKKRYRGWWKKLKSRTHRKVLAVDEKIGFLGGVNVRSEMQNWLDIQVSFTGKIVHSLLRYFAKNYIIAGGKKKNVRHLLKYKFRLLNSQLHLIFDEPEAKHLTARKQYAKALIRARERVILFSPYYFPDKDFLKALWIAKKRGIRVDLLIPFRSDIRLMTWLNYAKFGILNKLGVHIHMSPQMMHGKGVIVDDEWAMVGSSNLDYTSFYDNYESNIKIDEKRIVKKLKKTLEKWLKESKNLSDDEWQKRGIIQKIKEQIALSLYKLWHKER